MAAAVFLAGVSTGSSGLEASPLTTLCAGTADNFACPHEAAVRDTGVTGLLSVRYSGTACFGFLDFDDTPGSAPCGQPGSTVPKGFLVQHFTFQVPAGGLTSATIQLRLKAGPIGETHTDVVCFFKGSGFLTGAMIKDVPGAFGTWSHGQSATFTLDLAHLPPSFAASNILPQLAGGTVDVVVGNETGVDWMCLTVPTVVTYVPASDGRRLAVLAVSLILAGAWVIRSWQPGRKNASV